VRKLALDFDLTVLWPLILFAFILVWRSVRAYLSANRDYKFSLKRIEGAFDSREAEDEFLEWGSKRCADRQKTKKFVWLSAILFLVLVALMLATDKWQVTFAYGAWEGLWFAGMISFVTAGIMAWRYAEERNWWKFGVCLLAILMAAAATEHFFHQTANAHRAICPHCDDDDN
jgi:uncharacterized integral membrane protein